MDDWLKLLQGASFVGLLIVTTFAGLQRGQVQNLKGTIDGLRGDRDDLNIRLEARDRELTEERAQRASERAEDLRNIGELQSAVQTLSRTVTGEAHLVALEDLVTHLKTALDQHHEAAMANLEQIRDLLDRGAA